MPNQFSGPIPGQSLTGQPGGAPWEHPPQYTDVNDFLEMLFDRLVEKRQATRIGAMLSAGLSCEEVARTTIYSAFISGVISPDVALLATRPAIYIIVGIGQKLGVKNMKIMLPDQEQKDFLSNFVDLIGKSEAPAMPELAEETEVDPGFKGILGKLHG